MAPLHLLAHKDETQTSLIQHSTENNRLARKSRKQERRKQRAEELQKYQMRHGALPYEPRSRSERHYSRLACFGIGAADFIVPGTARAINGDYTKLATIDTLNWASRIGLLVNGRQLSNSPLIDLNRNSAPRQDGATQSHIDRSILYQNLYTCATFLFATYNLWDLYNSNREANPKSSRIFLAPFRFKHFYKNPYFYIPIGAGLALALFPSFIRLSK